MKNTKPFFFLFVSVLVVQLFSCKHNQNHEFQIIDSLQNELSNAIKIMEGIDDTKNKTLSSVVDSNLSYFMKNFKDSLEKPTAILLQDYKVISKEITRYYQIKDQLKANIEYTINQLEKLKLDYEKKKFDKETFDTYLATETKETKRLIDIVLERKHILNFEYTRFDTLNPIVLNLNKKIKV